MSSLHAGKRRSEGTREKAKAEWAVQDHKHSFQALKAKDPLGFSIPASILYSSVTLHRTLAPSLANTPHLHLALFQTLLVPTPATTAEGVPKLPLSGDTMLSSAGSAGHWGPIAVIILAPVANGTMLGEQQR